ncbi:MAG: hypothetical protein A4E24_00906 [Methanomethylovorans sp. PtaU1.Bin093]|nr:MAG: hypothetical protein A4E24_00906 [Methanomethylovorans sp. PtaU1.Bin093]
MHNARRIVAFHAGLHDLCRKTTFCTSTIWGVLAFAGKESRCKFKELVLYVLVKLRDIVALEYYIKGSPLEHPGRNIDVQSCGYLCSILKIDTIKELQVRYDLKRPHPLKHRVPYKER